MKKKSKKSNGPKLTTAQQKVLKAISRAPKTYAELARIVGSLPGPMSRTCIALEGMGLARNIKGVCTVSAAGKKA